MLNTTSVKNNKTITKPNQTNNNKKADTKQTNKQNINDTQLQVSPCIDPVIRGED